MSCEDILLRGGWKYKLPKLCGLIFLVKKDWYSNYFQTLILYLRLGEKPYHSCTGTTSKEQQASLASIKFDYSQEFWANILWTNETKVKLIVRCVSAYIWRKTNRAFHKKNIIPAVRHGGGIVNGLGLLCSFRTWMTCYRLIDGNMNTAENLEGECPAISLHLHLVILQTLLSKVTYNWGIHKAIHLEEANRQRKCS